MPSAPAYFIEFLTLLCNFLTTYIDSHQPELPAPATPWWAALPCCQHILHDPTYSWCTHCQCHIQTEGHTAR